MWLPSTSASVMIIILWYRSLLRVNSSVPIPVPREEMRVPISLELRTRSNRARSVLIIFPRRGRMAWVRLSRPCFADPPADSPSTRKSSEREGSFSWQSASFPGRFAMSRAPFLRVSSRAFLAASRAAAASITFLTMSFAGVGFSSSHSPSLALTLVSTACRTSEETSFSLVWLENLGSGTLIEMMEVSPSRVSSPERELFSLFARPWASM